MGGPSDRVVEVGSSTGLCTTILHGSAEAVLGLDVSLAQLEESRQAYPKINFQFLNIFEESDRLRALPEAQGSNVAFLDINGDREFTQVLHATELLRRHCFPGLLRLVVVKSEELHAALLASDTALHGGVHRLSSPCTFLEPWSYLRIP